MYWLLSAISILIVLYRLTLWKARNAESRFPPRGEFITVEGRRLHFVRSGTGPPVVLLHGSDGALNDFDPVFDLLARNHEVIAFDRPGHGYSDASLEYPPTSEVQARIVHTALVRLGIIRPILVGHSWSGSLCLAYALAYPTEIAGVALLGGWVYPARQPLLMYVPLLPILGPVVAATLLVIAKPALIRLILRQAFYPGRIPIPYLREADALWQRRPWMTRAFAAENVCDDAALRRAAERYARIRCPVVLLVGAEDRVVDSHRHAFRLHETIPDSVLIRLPETGHEIHWTRPDAVMDAVRQCGALATKAHRNACVSDEPTDPFEAARAEARRLIFKHGWNATAYQILDPQFSYWFGADGESVVGYVEFAGVRVAAGSPVCEGAALEQVVARFEEDSARAGRRVCFFGAAERLLDAVAPLDSHSAIVVGAQPFWRPEQWPEIVRRHASVRAQLNRARNKGVVVERWSNERAHSNADLERCLDEWLNGRAFPRLKFLTEPVRLDQIGDRQIFVARANANVVAFLVAAPVPNRNGWLIEQIVRRDAAPNGTAETLIDAAMRAFAVEEVEYVTLGLAPLSSRSVPDVRVEMPWLRLLLAWVRAHGKRFYNFEGLDTFKAKLQPNGWEPLYAISNENRFSVRSLYAIAGAFSGGSPIRAISSAVIGAARQEIEWLAAKRKEREAPR